MNISEKMIQALGQIVTGNGGLSPYKAGPALVRFFNSFGRNDIYAKGFPSRWIYAEGCIREFNGTDTIKKILEATLDPRDYNSTLQTQTYSVEKAAEYLNKFLTYENLVLKKTKNGFYKLHRADGSIIATEKLATLSHDFIIDQIKKANEKLVLADYDGAITNARSLVEAIQEEIIRMSELKIPQYDGDLLKLYKTTKTVLNLDPSQKDLSDTLKQILSGLTSLVAGIAGLSNKMADRHSRPYKPDKHHAKLAVNAALTFCEFLLDSFEYQKNKCDKRIA